ncbi:MAG: hypothetical protein H6985_15105 [Pseudomonadales bacterium]|nr:hypothetical protein [Pseudomonadales bacterium]
MLDTLGNLGDFVGGIAVLITLIYLAIQIRQNTAQVKIASDIARTDTYARSVESFSQFRSLLISDPEMADIYLRGSRELGSLSPVESIRFYLIIQQIFHTIQATIENTTATGTQVENPIHFYNLDVLLKQPGIRDWWVRENTRYEPNFVALLNNQLEQPE